MLTASDDASPLQRSRGLEWLRGGPLDTFLGDGLIALVGDEGLALPERSADLVISIHRLPFVDDYRQSLQAWFAAVRLDGHLAIIVTNSFLYERQFFLPSTRHPEQRRLYTPRTLLDEVEEALTPNSYRIRLLADDDRDYDYATPMNRDAAGHGEIVLVLQRIDGPNWPLADQVPPSGLRSIETTPNYSFEPQRTRIERDAGFAPERILLLKLDHVGDFVISVPALLRVRELFPQSHLALAAGSWNVDLARELAIFDEIIAFDAFPRNSSEAEPDPRGALALFHDRLADRAFDLAVDLRTEHDTRLLLRDIRAPRKAGLGTRAQFPFLDIFLPVDFSRGHTEMAHEFRFDPAEFASQGSANRSAFRISSHANTVERDCAVVWGPYRWLLPGRYAFEPFLDGQEVSGDGRCVLDVALDGHRVAEAGFSGGASPRLAFAVGPEGASFEFRIWAEGNAPSLDLDFFGGRLIRAGGGSVLHQAEYQQLLVELIRLRMRADGAPNETGND